MVTKALGQLLDLVSEIEAKTVVVELDFVDRVDREVVGSLECHHTSGSLVITIACDDGLLDCPEGGD
jgi:hypothetical protein